MPENPCSSLTCLAALPSTLTAMVTHCTEFSDRAVFDHLEVVDSEVSLVGSYLLYAKRDISSVV